MATITLAAFRFIFSPEQLALLPGYGALGADTATLEIADAELEGALKAMGDAAGGDVGAYRPRLSISAEDAAGYSAEMLARHCTGCAEHLAEAAAAPRIACAACKVCGGRHRINPAYQACPDRRFVSLWTLRRSESRR